MCQSRPSVVSVVAPAVFRRLELIEFSICDRQPFAFLTRPKFRSPTDLQTRIPY